MVRFLFLVAILAPVPSQLCSVFPNATQTAVTPIVTGNAYLGFVLPVHRPDLTSGAVCGPISNKDIIKTEAFFWALRTYGTRGDNRPRTQSGIVFDSCYSADKAYETLATVEEGKLRTPSEVVHVLAYLISDRHSVAVRVNKLFSSHNITAISSSISDPGTPSGFYHLAPTAQQESEAILKLLSRSKWRYVQVLYANNGYSRQVYNSFMSSAANYFVTVSRSEMMEDEVSVPDLDSYPDIVVVFAYVEQKKKIFEKFGNRNFIFVTTNLGNQVPAGDGMSYNSRIVELSGTEGSHLYDKAVVRFRDYMKSLTQTGTVETDNPWYSTFWENLHKCSVSGSGQSSFKTLCSNTVTLGNVTDIDDQEIAMVVKGVDLMLEALTASCLNKSCATDTLTNTRNSFSSNFKSFGLERGHFDRLTLGPKIWNYTLYLFSWDGSQNRYIGEKVGSVSHDTISINALVDMQRNEAVYSRIVSKPLVPEEDYWTRFDAWGYIWIIIIAVLASLGILLVLIIAILLCVLKVKAAMSNYVWLYAVLLFGALLGYLTLYAYLPLPTTATCGIIRFGVGLSYGICFSVMVVLGLLLCKKSEMFSSERVSNIFIAVSLILLITIELVILISWMIWTPPGVSYILFPGFRNPRKICNHYTLGAGNTLLRTTFENHLLHLIYIMFLILLVLLLAIFIFMRRKNLRASRNKKESLALLATGIGTGLGTVAIWVTWTLVGALVGPRYNDVHNFGEAAMAFGLWFTLTWLLIFLLIQVVNTWRSASRSKTNNNDVKINMTHINHDAAHAKGNNYGQMVSAVDGKIHHANHGSVNKIPLIIEPNGGGLVRSYEQHVDTRFENNAYLRPPPLPENEVVHGHQHVFHTGSNFCAECGFQHDPNALRLLHPRSEHGQSSHDNSFDLSTAQRVRGVETAFGYEPRKATSMQALYLLHPRSRPVSRAGSLDMGNRRYLVPGGHSRVARSEIGTSYVTHGGHYGSNIIDLRRPRPYDRAYYYPPNQNPNIYFTEKGSSVI